MLAEGRKTQELLGSRPVPGRSLRPPRLGSGFAAVIAATAAVALAATHA